MACIVVLRDQVTRGVQQSQERILEGVVVAVSSFTEHGELVGLAGDQHNFEHVNVAGGLQLAFDLGVHCNGGRRGDVVADRADFAVKGLCNRVELRAHQVRQGLAMHQLGFVPSQRQAVFTGAQVDAAAVAQGGVGRCPQRVVTGAGGDAQVVFTADMAAVNPRIRVVTIDFVDGQVGGRGTGIDGVRINVVQVDVCASRTTGDVEFVTSNRVGVDVVAEAVCQVQVCDFVVAVRLHVLFAQQQHVKVAGAVNVQRQRVVVSVCFSGQEGLDGDVNFVVILVAWGLNVHSLRVAILHVVHEVVERTVQQHRWQGRRWQGRRELNRIGADCCCSA